MIEFNLLYFVCSKYKNDIFIFFKYGKKDIVNILIYDK